MFRLCLAKFGGQCPLLAPVYSCLTDPPRLPQGCPWLATVRSLRAAPETSRLPGLLFSNVREHSPQILFPASPTKSDQCKCSGAPAWPFRILVHTCGGGKPYQKRPKGSRCLHRRFLVTSCMRILALVARRQKSRFPKGIRRHGVEFASFLPEQAAPTPARQHRKHLLHTLVAHWRTDWIPHIYVQRSSRGALLHPPLSILVGEEGLFSSKKTFKRQVSFVSKARGN